ncbi:aconitase/3-isopropylmalate dehydratase large subunit family protein [Methanospirillum stamsii]|uniref:3-isopropylmalate dehydratase large subunit n=1 Tax=Methanospirillum stamsii TaxID=1277351 RepID=A0A2V2NAU7_9EURY|nr:aconitase/3-isopropylmalate dehydratase large subunit family protein [Methanospirillum stamsii]PWR72403.1 3-isopropylmalate dehydratase large subunit [Methanospirillum stamsii]
MVTLSEKILGAKAGTYVDRQVDRAFCHDGTGIQAKLVFDRIGSPKLADPASIYVIYDHISPANNSQTAELQAELRDFSHKNGVNFMDIGSGICHQVMAEGLVHPGEVVIGADSHSCTLGALGAFATGVGASDMAGIWISGETWLRIPDSIGIHLSDVLPAGVEWKDLALSYVSLLGMDGATYAALEFVGEAAQSVPMEGRLTLCNMAVEAGAKTGLFYADQETARYLALYHAPVDTQVPENPSYVRECFISLLDLEPVCAVPHRVDTVEPVTKLAGTPVDQIFIGTCTNGRFEDLKRAAEILKGHRVSVRTIVVPASEGDYLKAIRTGVAADLIQAGCVMGPPGCGPCLGAHMGVLGEGEVGLSTANRNFKNRMGVGASYYLCSPSTAAASALSGEIADPREVI